MVCSVFLVKLRRIIIIATLDGPVYFEKFYGTCIYIYIYIFVLFDVYIYYFHTGESYVLPDVYIFVLLNVYIFSFRTGECYVLSYS